MQHTSSWEEMWHLWMITFTFSMRGDTPLMVRLYPYHLPLWCYHASIVHCVANLYNAKDNYSAKIPSWLLKNEKWMLQMISHMGSLKLYRKDGHCSSMLFISGLLPLLLQPKWVRLTVCFLRLVFISCFLWFQCKQWQCFLYSFRFPCAEVCNIRFSFFSNQEGSCSWSTVFSIV